MKTIPLLLQNLCKLLLACCLLLPNFARAQVSYSLLHSFTETFSPPEGIHPTSALILASDGNFYGTTTNGGVNNNGTIFEMTPSGAFTTIYSFIPTSTMTLSQPCSALVEVQTGTGNYFYGVASGGGDPSHNAGGVFNFILTGTNVSMVNSFSYNNNGTTSFNNPADLCYDGTGYLYGVLFGGGLDGGGGLYSFSLSNPISSLSTAPFLQTGTVGAFPRAGLIEDGSGNFYGTTTSASSGTYEGSGSVFRYTPAGGFTVLHSFAGQPDGAYCEADLTLGTDGNIYGVTRNGGLNNQGTIFKIASPASTATYSILYSFDGSKGAEPRGKLIEIGGEFLGTANSGGTLLSGNSSLCGTVFKMDATGSVTVLHNFSDGSMPNDGANPHAGLVVGPDGALYGTTYSGGTPQSLGTIYRIAISPPLLTPVISPSSGTSSYTQFNVTVTSTTGSTIYYTLDGSTPTTSSPSISSGGTILISKTETLKAMATISGSAPSSVATASYEVTGQAAGGSSFSVFLKTDGTVWAAGYDAQGQLGNGSTTGSQATPAKIASLSGVVEVAAGASHALALSSGGTVSAWGLNGNGELGDNTTSNRSTPVLVKTATGTLSGITAVSAGVADSVALKSDGTVWGWGLNSSGQLGNGSTTDSHVAVQVLQKSTGLALTGIVAISAGDAFNLALDNGGNLYAWGANAEGQLGDGTTTSENEAVLIEGGVVLISAGYQHSLALETDGTLQAWGANSYGQLGDGTTTQRTSPETIAGVTGATALAAGQYFSMLLKSDGTVWATGDNSYGEIGNDSLLKTSTWTQMSGITNAVEIAAGYYHNLVIEVDGTLWGCGENLNGQLGNGIYSIQPLPGNVTGLTSVASLSSGGYHNLFLKTDGTIAAIGENAYGELGDGSVTIRTSPVAVDMSSLVSATAVTSGAFHSLAIKSDGTVWAWGLNGNGELGTGTTTNSSTPQQVSSLTNATAIAAGSNFSLAVKNDGSVWSWGADSQGQLAIGSYGQRTTPVQVRTSSSTNLANVTQVVAGSQFAAALKSDGTVWVWGINTYGQMGQGGGAQRLYAGEISDPTDPTGYLTGVTSISAGQNDVLVIKNDGTAWGWGANDQGQLGPGIPYETSVPLQIALTGTVTALRAGSVTSYAETSDGKTWAWGHGGYGELGDGTIPGTRSSIGQMTGLSGIVDLAAGASIGLALKEDDTVETWGLNNMNECGYGSNYAVAAPAPGFYLWAGASVPTVSITAPANNASETVGSAFTLSVSAAETGGTIASVQYFSDGALVGQSSTAPFSLNVTPSTWGNFTYTAIATDSNGNTSSVSSPVTVQVPED